MPAMPATDEAGRLAVLRARLASPMPDDRPWGWLGPLLVTAFGAFLRFNRLRVPRALVFDETYYVKDAWSILNHGVELNLVSNANTIIQAGHANIFAPCNGTPACGEYVVQPEMGKLLIAAGEWLFGLNSFGWRFASAVFGSLAISADVPDRPADDPVHPAGLHRRAADVAGRPGVRAVPDRDPGHLPDVLRAGRVRLRGHRPGHLPRRAGRAGRAPGGRPGRAAARDPPVAGGGRDLPRPGGGDQVGRGLVHRGVRGAGHRVGHRRPPGRRPEPPSSAAASGRRCGCR